MSYNKANPFEWGVYEPLTVEKNEVAETEFKTIPTQRNAAYNTPAEETFTNTALDSFVENIEAPTPQIKHLCGIECPKQ